MENDRLVIAGHVQDSLQLHLAYIGIANGLLSALSERGPLESDELARTTAMDAGYVRRWCDAAFAFGLLETSHDRFSLTALGSAFRPEAPASLMPFAVQSILSAHMSERAAGLMRTGERPGESVLAERQTILPWFGPMLEQQFGPLFEQQILSALPLFHDIDERGGLVIDLGCGNGWYLRALLRRYPRMRGMGLDGFDENVRQATARAQAEGLGDRLQFAVGDIYDFNAREPGDAIAMTRALHHVWDQHERVFRILHDHLKPGGRAVIWEPNWPAQREQLRTPTHRVMAFQNLTEHVQGNHFLRADEIAQAFRDAGLAPEIHLFQEGREAVVTGRRAVAA